MRIPPSLDKDAGRFRAENRSEQCRKPCGSEAGECIVNRLWHARTVAFKKRGGVPNGIRTRAAAVKGRCPGPLDDGDAVASKGGRT